MFIDQVTNAGAIPTLERVVQFAAGRQSLIAHNIANLSTPRFQPQDVSVAAFRKVLGKAVDTRRATFGGHRGELNPKDTRELDWGVGGRRRGGGARGLTLHPERAGRNVMFHDRNNRDLERMMQDLAENTATFRVATELLRNRMGLMRSAITERVN